MEYWNTGSPKLTILFWKLKHLSYVCFFENSMSLILFPYCNTVCLVFVQMPSHQLANSVHTIRLDFIILLFWENMQSTVLKNCALIN